MEGLIPRPAPAAPLGSQGEAGKPLRADDASLAALVAAGVAEVASGAPASTLPVGRLYFQTVEGKVSALWLGQKPSAPLKLLDATGTPADGSVTLTSFVASLLDGSAATPSLRTLHTDPRMPSASDNNAISEKAVRNAIAVKVPQPTSGRWLIPPNSGLATATLGTVNTMLLFKHNISAETLFDRIGVGNITAKGEGTGLVVRTGLYADDGTGTKPTGSPLLDAGTLTATETGTKQWEITKTLGPGSVWQAVVLQGTLTSAPTFTTVNYVGANILGALDLSSSYRGLQQTGVSGALPEIGTLEPSKLTTVLVGLRVK